MKRRKPKQPGCLESIVAILFLPLTIPIRLIAYPFLKFAEARRNAPSIPGRKLFSRKPNLRTPQEAATFVVMNIAHLTPEQIGEIEKAVNRNHPVRSCGDTGAHSALYGCRIIKPLQTMKDVRKMADRWNSAWCGDTSGNHTGMLVHDKQWTDLCFSNWAPFARMELERAVNSSGKITMAEARRMFYPPLDSPP